MSFTAPSVGRRRFARTVCATLLAITAVATVVAPASAVTHAHSSLPAAPRIPREPAAIEGFAPYQPQFFCRKTVMPGVKSFEKLVLATYKNTVSDGDMRACGVPGVSEHKDGRAWDWGAEHRNPQQRAAGESLLKWLFATDANGNSDAMFRRLGLMYIIWNKRIWGSWDQRWEPYACSGPTLCHVNHMHFSFSWAGAEKKTSFWTHVIGGPAEPPLPKVKAIGAHRVLRLGANAGTVTAHWLLVGGATYDVVASGRWQHAGNAADPVCMKTAQGWQPSSQPIDIGGDELREWGEQWTPTKDTGNGCNTATHAYKLVITPDLLTTLTAGLPTASNHDSGSVKIKVTRTA